MSIILLTVRDKRTLVDAIRVRRWKIAEHTPKTPRRAA